jgi:hypothetical protein
VPNKAKNQVSKDRVNWSRTSKPLQRSSVKVRRKILYTQSAEERRIYSLRRKRKRGSITRLRDIENAMKCVGIAIKHRVIQCAEDNMHVCEQEGQRSRYGQTWTNGWAGRTFSFISEAVHTAIPVVAFERRLHGILLINIFAWFVMINANTDRKEVKEIYSWFKAWFAHDAQPLIWTR